jgi:predicted porin
MKKSLLALAVLGAFAGVASAQSWVKVDGTVDLSAKYVKNDGSGKRYSLSQDGINSSQLRFSGREDLGGGLWAGFNLNAGVNADTGSMNSQFFNRRATVSLGGGFGEIRLGRDYTPTFWNNTIFDAFGTNGLGDSSHVLQMATGTFVRANNAIQYFLPSNIGGVYGQFMAAASEGASGPNPYGVVGGSVGANPGRYIGGRVGFAAGPFDIAGAYATQRLDNTATQPSQKTMNIGASYDLGVAKLMGYFNRDTLSFGAVDRKENRFSLSAVVPIGQGEVHAGYDYSKLNSSGTNFKIDQIKVGYVYNLSKRTALYTNVSRLNNKNNSQNSVTSGTAQTAAPTPAGKSQGAEFGLRHFF